MEELVEPLPSERRRRKALAEQEAVDGVRWHEDPSDVACRKIYRVFLASTNRPDMVERDVRIIREINDAEGADVGDIETTLTGGWADPNDRLDCIAAIGVVLGRLGDALRGKSFSTGWEDAVNLRFKFDAGFFRNATNDIFLNHRVEWLFMGQSLVERGSQELHAAVVRPASELLGSNPKFVHVQRAYDKALLELSNDDPGDAITDANSALQEMFRVLGVEGSSASDQALKAEKKGLLVGYDRALVDGIVKLCAWVNAERSQRGDAHGDGSAALKADAWLAIHVVGALILRLANETQRGEVKRPIQLMKSNHGASAPDDSAPF